MFCFIYYSILPEMHSQINSGGFVGKVNSISSFTVREEFLVCVSKKKKKNPQWEIVLSSLYKPPGLLCHCTGTAKQIFLFERLRCNSVEGSTIHGLLCHKSYNFTSSIRNSILKQCRIKFFTDSQRMTQIQTIKSLSQNFWCFI